MEVSDINFDQVNWSHSGENLPSESDLHTENGLQFAAIESKFLSWVKRGKLICPPMTETTYETPWGNAHRVTCEVYSKRLDRYFLGIGRHLTRRSTAVSIAVGEAMERLISREIYADRVHASHALTVDKGRVVVTKCDVKNVSLPPAGVFSSNGWALHFDPQVALISAVKEALERHILLYNYLKSGWSGFRLESSREFQKYSYQCLLAREAVAGMRAGITAVKSPTHCGHTMGYLCLPDEASLHREAFQVHPAFIRSYQEAFEPCFYYENFPAQSNEQSVRHGYRELQKIQLHYLLRSNDFTKLNSALHIGGGSALSANLLSIDLTKSLGLDFPLSICFVFGLDFLPLFLHERLRSEEDIVYVRTLLDRHGFTEIPEYHPVI